MNIAESFVEWMELSGIGVSGDTIFIGNAPSSNHVTDNIYWVVASGGTPVAETMTGESTKQYTLDVFYRSTDYKDIYDTMYELESAINCSDCVEFDDVEMVSIRATTYPADEDLDSEDRKIGMVQITMEIFAKCIIEVS